MRISCLTGAGIAELEQQIVARIGGGKISPDSTFAVNARHRECLRRAFDACDTARQALNQQMAPEYAAVDLKSALRSLGQIIGEIDVEQVLDSVFRQFCIGK